MHSNVRSTALKHIILGLREILRMYLVEQSYILGAIGNIWSTYKTAHMPGSHSQRFKFSLSEVGLQHHVFENYF